MERLLSRGKLAGAVLCGLLLGASLLAIDAVYGDQQLQLRSLQIASSQPSVTTTYKLGFTLVTPGTLGSIRVQFCANSPLWGAPCTVPAGFDVSQATIINQFGETGFSISSSTTSNELILTRVPVNSSAQPVTYELNGVVNPSSIGSYYARIRTYASADATGPDSDYGGLAYSIADTLSISAEVPPYLIFCTGTSISSLDCASASGDYVNFGELHFTNTSIGQSQILVATNAANGYSVNANGSTLTSGNNVINSLSNTDISRPGISQFGINLRANVSPTIGNDPGGPGIGTPAPAYNSPNFYQFIPGDNVASGTQPEDYRKYTISYIVNVPKGQAPGVYASTITYVGVGNF